MCAVRARGLVPPLQRDTDAVLWRHLSGPIGAGANDNRSPSSTLTDLIAVAISIALLGVPLLLVAISAPIKPLRTQQFQALSSHKNRLC